jgi:hypothetical protein
MRRSLQVCFILMFLFVPTIVIGDVQWTNCIDGIGNRVLMLETPGTNNFYATVQNGGPVILWDTIFARNLSPQAQTFFYAHECAHHALGHTLTNIPSLREKQADCWAINTLVGSGVFNRADLSQVQSEISQFPGDWWVYLPGPRRAMFFEECLASAGIATAPRQPVCRVITVPEEYTDYQIVLQPQQIPCQHCGCNAWGWCGCRDQFDVIQQPVQVPVTRTRLVPRQVCD